MDEAICLSESGLLKVLAFLIVLLQPHFCHVSEVFQQMQAKLAIVF